MALFEKSNTIVMQSNADSHYPRVVLRLLRLRLRHYRATNNYLGWLSPVESTF